MPSQHHQNFDEQIYEVMRMGKGVPFTFSTGGVKYKAVFQHKEALERESLSHTDSNVSATSSPVPGVERQATEETIGSSKQ